MPKAKKWRCRFRTLRAMWALSKARLLVAIVPFNGWRHSLGLQITDGVDSAYGLEDAKRLAADVEWAAKRLPIPTKCLPRAMALSWLLRRNRIAHTLVFAVRPAQLRRSPDALHAWVEIGATKVIGDLPGPWVETLRLGA